jgi:hypothetical protein
MERTLWSGSSVPGAAALGAPTASMIGFVRESKEALDVGCMGREGQE